MSWNGSRKWEANPCDFERTFLFIPFNNVTFHWKNRIDRIRHVYRTVVPKLIFSRRRGRAYYKFWALGGALIRSGALIWSWALIRAFTLVCYNFISKFKISTNPGLSQSIFDQPSPSGWDGVQDQYGIIVLITLSCNPSAVVRSGKLLSSIKYNISVYSKLWQAKERLLAVSLSSVILGTWRKFIVTSSIHMKNMVLFVLLSSVHFVKRTNIVLHLMWWKTLRTSPARVRIGNSNSVSVSKLTLQSYYFTCSTR